MRDNDGIYAIAIIIIVVIFMAGLAMITEPYRKVCEAKGGILNRGYCIQLVK